MPVKRHAPLLWALAFNAFTNEYLIINAMIEFTRTFHPIGQGAFYSEEHRLNDKSFVAVYDCGSSTLLRSRTNNQLKKEVESALRSVEIDVLFISHFDSDHVNGIEFLKPKVIVLPILSDEEKIVLPIISALDGVDYDNNIETTIRDKYGDSVKIVHVKKYERETRDEGLYDISDLENNKEIESGAKIVLPFKTSSRWAYIPFNFDMERTMVSSIIADIKKAKIDVDKLKSDIVYLKSKLDELRNIFKNLKCNLNDHSMVLYSGTYAVDKQYPLSMFCGECRHCCRGYYSCRLNCFSCVYFGDITIDSSVMDGLRDGLKSLCANVSTIQVPHHGSRRSYSSVLFTPLSNVLYCVISFGKNNSYRHPSGYVVNDMLRFNKYVKYVTEDKDSILIQYGRY